MFDYQIELTMLSLAIRTIDLIDFISRVFCQKSPRLVLNSCSTNFAFLRNSGFNMAITPRVFIHRNRFWLLLCFKCKTPTNTIHLSLDSDAFCVETFCALRFVTATGVVLFLFSFFVLQSLAACDALSTLDLCC